ncbi:MAG: S1-like domain-containing RNA-binding protein [Chitinophagales bacterium]
MINIGEYNTLKAIRTAEQGMYLGHNEDETVLLPNRYIPKNLEIGDEIKVFVYGDNYNRPIATTLQPLITLNQFAVLKVKSVEKFGAFMDWGIAKDLLVPFNNQYKKLEVGKSYMIHLYLDEVSERLVGSAKIPSFLMTEIITVKVGDEVDLMVYEKSELGVNVIVNNIHRGLVFWDELFQEVKIGDTMKGYVSKIRPDNKIDISLNKFGYQKVEPNAEKILAYIKQHNGEIPFTDKSDPDEIYKTFKMSKKVFKKALGALYKQRLITIEKNRVKLT